MREENFVTNLATEDSRRVECTAVLFGFYLAFFFSIWAA